MNKIEWKDNLIIAAVMFPIQIITWGLPMALAFLPVNIALLAIFDLLTGWKSHD